MRPEQTKKEDTSKQSAPQAPKTSASTTTDKTSQPNEGEGNRTAARRYDTATAEYIESGRSDAAAKAAAEALDGGEAKELREAETFAKEGHPKKSSS